MDSLQSFKRLEPRLHDKNDDVIDKNIIPPPEKVIISMDVNLTCMIADPISGYDVPEAINVYLTGLVWMVNDVALPDLSYDAPESDALSFYTWLKKKYEKEGKDQEDAKEVLKIFTTLPVGERWRKEWVEMEKALRWPYELNEKTECLILKSKDGKLYHRMIPSFFELIEHLIDLDIQEDNNVKTKYQIMFRTFGPDLPEIAKVMNAYCDGCHPGFPIKDSRKEATQKFRLDLDQRSGQILREDPNIIELQLGHTDGKRRHDKKTISGDDDIYNFLGTIEYIWGIRDYYEYWRNNSFSNRAGKPIYLDRSFLCENGDGNSKGIQHILFDDNIRFAKKEDSIADLRIKNNSKDDKFQSVEKKNLSNYKDLSLIKAELFGSLLDKNYFKYHVEKAIHLWQTTLTNDEIFNDDGNDNNQVSCTALTKTATDEKEYDTPLILDLELDKNDEEWVYIQKI